MGNVLISLDSKYEEILRRLAQEKYGSKKGSISAVVEEALRVFVEKERKEAVRTQFLRTIENGINMGFKGHVYKSRSDIYD